MQLLHKGPVSAGSPSGYFQMKEASIPPLLPARDSRARGGTE